MPTLCPSCSEPTIIHTVPELDPTNPTARRVCLGNCGWWECSDQAVCRTYGHGTRSARRG